jgi:shikimate kinase
MKVSCFSHYSTLLLLILKSYSYQFYGKFSFLRQPHKRQASRPPFSSSSLQEHDSEEDLGYQQQKLAFLQSNLEERKIFIIGETTSDKSTVGRLLAERLDFPFHDTDEVLESFFQIPVCEFLQRSPANAEAFQRYERALIDEICDEPGPGIVSIRGNLDFDKYIGSTKEGIVLYLKLQPLSGDEGESAELEILHDEKKEFSEKKKADIIVPVSNKIRIPETVDLVVGSLCDFVEKELTP